MSMGALLFFVCGGTDEDNLKSEKELRLSL